MKSETSDSHIAHVFAVETEFFVMALSDNSICSQSQSAGKHMASVVIRMTSDEIDTTG